MKVITLDFVIFTASNWFEKLKESHKRKETFKEKWFFKEKQSCEKWSPLTFFLAAASSFFIPAENSKISVMPKETLDY